MKIILLALLIAMASALYYQGLLVQEYQTTLAGSSKAFENKEYESALKKIEMLRNSRAYWPIRKYAVLDVFEMENNLSYQSGRTLAETGRFKESYGLFDKCAAAKNRQLAFLCLYQQGNLALAQGNLGTAEKKWQAALEKNSGGHDFDTQVNLELLKSEKKKGQAAALAAIQSHRRSQNPYFFLRPPGSKSGAIRQ